MIEIMREMNFPPSFVQMVRTMYSGIRLRFKVNGRVDRIAVEPSNGVAQGCPLSPCLYLLCIQGLISLLNTDAKRAGGIRGIPMPRVHVSTASPAPTVMLSAFADDVCVFLQDSSQLTRFRQLLDTYCEGAGAKNSWEKTVGLRVGAERGKNDLPEGWEEGRDINCSPEMQIGGETVRGVIRYLGVFLGAPEGVAKAWLDKTCARISQRSEAWRERSMPRTRGGRAVALRNSILAQAWYLVDNQTPPNLPDMVEKWRREAWTFMRNGSNTGATDVSHVTLMQDYAEGGKRIPDVERFACALKARRLRHLLEPHESPHTEFALYWIRRYYGHLRQGLRLLISNCDFLFFDDTPANEKVAPLEWNYTLKTIGGMRGLQPAMDQGGCQPHVHYPLGNTREGAGGMVRTVASKPVRSIGEILMEPLFYNPNLSGWWGSKITDPPEWETEHRRAHPKAHWIRLSADCKERARVMFDTTKRFARAGITHVAHLISWWQAGEPVELLSHRQHTRRYHGTLPFTVEEYDSLLNALPMVWRSAVEELAQRRTRYPQLNLQAVVDETPLPVGAWIRDEWGSGDVGQLESYTPTVLHAFSGKKGRTDGLAAYLKASGLACKEVDVLNDPKKDNLLDNPVYERLLAKAHAGEYRVGMFGTPCSTFSVARIGADTNGGPRAVRCRWGGQLLGRHDLTPEERREVEIANTLVERSVQLARAIVGSGGSVVFENPSDRGDALAEDTATRQLFQPEWASHAPLWLMPCMRDARRDLGLRSVTFPQCGLCGSFEKFTTLWYSPSMAPTLDVLHSCTCRHGSHSEVARGKDRHKRWISAEAAAYPAQMNELLAKAAASTLSHAEQAQTLRVRRWYKINKRGQLTGGYENDVKQADLPEHVQVHVWTREALTHSKEEADYRERHEEEQPPDVQWCGGKVMDWSILRPDGGDSLGAVNLGDWAWAWHPTDRTRPPIPAASADVFHLYNISLSYNHCPPRPLSLLDVHHPPDPDHTTWADLLVPPPPDPHDASPFSPDAAAAPCHDCDANADSHEPRPPPKPPPLSSSSAPPSPDASAAPCHDSDANADAHEPHTPPKPPPLSNGNAPSANPAREYVVENLLQVRWCIQPDRTWGRSYQVRWKGYEPADDTW